MKQKWTIKTKILLLFAAVSVVFMVYSLLNLSPEDKLKEEGFTSIVDPMKQTASREKFELLPIEKDPFFGGTRSDKVKVSKIKITKKTPKETVLWPSISYNGVVESGNGVARVYILVVNGKQQLFEKGEVRDGIKLVSVGAKTLKVSFQGKTKEIDL